MWFSICCYILLVISPILPSTNVTNQHVQSVYTRSRVPRQLSSKSCVLPPYPAHGSYVVVNEPRAIPGDSSDSYELLVGCRRGYGFKETDGGGDTAGFRKLYCVKGKWSQSIPVCVRYCKLNPEPSVRYRCEVPGVGYKVCEQYVPPGTVVDPVCNRPIYYSTDALSYMKCFSGFWNYVAKCIPECGRVTPDGEQLVAGGQRAKRGELPWHAGIYTKNTKPFMQICGGSLVSNNAVISAAHCFWKDAAKQLPASQFAVAIAKLFRPWNNERDFDAQRSDVKEIKLPTLFSGGSTNFQEDIAVVILTTPFVYMPHVRPVCLNFDPNFERRQLLPGKLGKVAGWGLLASNGKASPILQVVQLPYIPLETCLNTVPETFKEYITADKICAGYTNGTALCKGDSGGGLAMTAHTELDIERYYLRGVVSAAPSNDIDVCNANTYTAFTRVIKHEDFIKQSMASSEKTCPSYLFQCDDGACVGQGADCNGKQDCADGSDEADDLCKPIFDIRISTKPSTPLPVDTRPQGTTCEKRELIDNGKYETTNLSNTLHDGQFTSLLLVRVTCEDGYDLVSAEENEANLKSISLTCLNGTWDRELPSCRLSLECGRVSAKTQPKLEVGESPAQPEELPWHTGIYDITKNYRHVCDGSIISRTAILTAAHCFTQGDNPSNYKVATGKLFAPWNDGSDVFNVREIHIAKTYETIGEIYKNSVAVLTVDPPVTFSSKMRPVCINYNSDLDELNPTRLVRTAAWSLSPTKELKRVDMTYLTPVICNTTVADNLLKYNTDDKTCTGFSKDRIFRSLAGSGLVFLRDVSGGKRYYLTAVLAYTVKCQKCVDSKEVYYVYSNLDNHMEFIKKYI